MSHLNRAGKMYNNDKRKKINRLLVVRGQSNNTIRTNLASNHYFKN